MGQQVQAQKKATRRTGDSQGSSGFLQARGFGQSYGGSGVRSGGNRSRVEVKTKGMHRLLSSPAMGEVEIWQKSSQEGGKTSHAVGRSMVNRLRDMELEGSVVQRAWVGARHLHGMGKILGRPSILNFFSKALPKNMRPVHKHIFYQDDLQPTDRGYGPNGVYSSGDGGREEQPYDYDIEKYGLDDHIVRQAQHTVELYGSFDAQDYKVKDHNCQVYVNAVLDLYHNLKARDEI